MIIGTGIDIVSVARIRRVLDRYGARFKQRVFADIERHYCESKADPAIHYALRFAAKEAFVKATGTGLGSFGFHEVSLVNGPEGKPELTVTGEGATWLRNKNVCRIWFSGSHTRDYAVANVILEGKDRRGNNFTF